MVEARSCADEETRDVGRDGRDGLFAELDTILTGG